MKQEKIELFGKRFPTSSEAIVITGKKIQNIPDLSAFKNLKRLDLSRNEITKTEGLESLNQLEELNLDNNRISKLENLSGLSNLKSLSLSSNQITKIENLNNLKNLESLQLSSNQIEKIDGLLTLEGLRYLYLINNKINLIENLENLTELEELFLGENTISSITGLKNCKNLWKIYLNDNQIDSLLFDNLPESISFLNLASNSVTEIVQPKIKLKDLQLLSLTGNPLHTIRFIENLPSITNFSIEGKKCKAIAFTTYLHIKERYANKSGGSFQFYTSKTTTPQDIDEFIAREKIEVVD
jgi:Leucine-rich repeat (LRR) protein